MDKIPDHKIDLELIMEQWKSSPNLVAIITAALDRGNDMEDAIFEIRDLTNIDTATGINLDVLGKPWNEGRENRSDDDYRIAIKQKKLEYYSGTPEEIISIIKASYGGSFVSYSPEYPGKYRARSDSIIPLESLQEISMAGVRGFLSGLIVDAVGNHIVSAIGNHIIHVSGDTVKDDILDGNGDQILDGNGEILQIAGFI